MPDCDRDGVREAEYLRKFGEYRLVETVDSHYGKGFGFCYGVKLTFYKHECLSIIGIKNPDYHNRDFLFAYRSCTSGGTIGLTDTVT